MSRHIFITGPPGIGKTTLVKKICGRLVEDKTCATGFYTEEVRQEGRRVGFDVIALDGVRRPLARVGDEARGPKVGQYTVSVADFEAVALDVLEKYQPQGDGSRFLVVDEIGKMELFSTKFAAKVMEVFNNVDARIICTIPISKGKSIPLIEQLKKRSDKAIFSLTVDTRDSVFDCIYSTLHSKKL